MLVLAKLLFLVAAAQPEAGAPTPATTLKGHTHTITCLAFAPKGDRLASGSKDQTVRLWDLAANKCVAVLEGHRDMVVSVAFSPNGEMLASTSHDSVINLW